MNTDCGRLHVETVVRDRRVSDAGQVWCDYRKSLGEHWNNRPPHQRGLGVAVQQDERWAVAGRQVMQLDAVDLGRARGYGLAGCGSCICSRRECGGEEEWAERRQGQKDQQAQKKVQSAFHEKLLTRDVLPRSSGGGGGGPKKQRLMSALICPTGRQSQRPRTRVSAPHEV